MSPEMLRREMLRKIHPRAPEILEAEMGARHVEPHQRSRLLDLIGAELIRLWSVDRILEEGFVIERRFRLGGSWVTRLIPHPLLNNVLLQDGYRVDLVGMPGFEPTPAKAVVQPENG
jgi:hypothetical protein